ncbi:MAG: FAD-binding oxidoreductase, partial [Planctomycetales bacterium]
MSTDLLPIDETVAPMTVEELAETVSQAAAAKRAVYPIGGATSLDFGLVPSRPGIGLAMSGLDRVVDYPVRDMTITVEAGITMGRLRQTLAKKKQRLPVDVPQPDLATVGGVLAADFNGPRRFGAGTIRDYVIGIEGVDGRGVAFHGGGQVVKNVAGYDFCKLLTGSLGTLAIITEVTMKVKPLPAASAFVTLDLPEPAAAEPLLSELIDSRTTPVAVELLSGDAWRDDPAMGPLGDGKTCRLTVGLEGTEVEVQWMANQLKQEWSALGHGNGRETPSDQVEGLWTRLAEFPHCPSAPLVIQACVSPSRVTRLIETLLEVDPDCSIAAHAADGIVTARMARFDPVADVARVLIGRIQAAVVSGGVPGSGVVVLSGAREGAWTRQAVWGPLGDEIRVMRAV